MNVWMINTGWTGGAYGIGERIKLSYTRAMITVVLEGKLNKARFKTHPVFGMKMPVTCPGVPAQILDPKNTWADPDTYDLRSKELAGLFVKNFEKYKAGVSYEILAAGPNL